MDLTIFKNVGHRALTRDIAGDTWYHVSDRVELKEMPPEGRPWPSDEERTRSHPLGRDIGRQRAGRLQHDRHRQEPKILSWPCDEPPAYRGSNTTTRSAI